METTSKAIGLLLVAGVDEVAGTLGAVAVWAIATLADNDNVAAIQSLPIIK